MSGERVTIVPAFELDREDIEELDAVTSEVERVFVDLVAVARRVHTVWSTIEGAGRAWLPSHEETVAVLVPRLHDLGEIAGAFEGINETLMGHHGGMSLDELEALAEKIRGAK